MKSTCVMNGISDYLFEAGMLKRVKRSGWWTEGIKDPESVAEHSWRASILAFLLAKMEGLDDDGANKLCTAAAFHDMHETRLLDLNKITARYVRVDESLERKVERDQLTGMDPKLKDAVLGVLRLSDRDETILNDADYLECAFQAKEYLGKRAEPWFAGIQSRLKTKSAKALLLEAWERDPRDWFDGLEKLE